MFDFSKQPQHETGDTWLKKGDQAIQQVASQVKTTASELAEAVNHGADQTQDKAKRLIRNLKQNLEQLTTAAEQAAEATVESTVDTAKQADVNAQIVTPLKETLAPLGDAVRSEAGALKDSALQTLRKHPVASVLLAAGAGLLIGYLLNPSERK